MSEQLQLRRGAAAQISAFTGAAGELVVDTTNNRLVLQDGATVGGFAAAKLSEVYVSSRTAVSDVNYTVLATDRIVAYTVISAPRTVTLPLAANYPPGQTLWIIDESGSCSATNLVTIAHAGSDTIDGAANAYLNASFDATALTSNGSNKWTILSTPPGEQYSLLSVGTAPDPSNVLSVAGSSALFSGSNFNVVVNKSTSANTASVIFQDGYSGRAQMGLNGSDNYSFKVSPNGSSWTTALQFDATTGAATLANLRTAIADSNYAALATDRTLAYSSITAARSVTLPSAASFASGLVLSICDESGSCSATNTISIVRTGTDTIDGLTSIVLNSPYGAVSLIANSVGKWTVMTPTGPAASIPNMDGTGGSGSAFTYARSDHTHPSDSSRVALSGASFSGSITLAANAAAVTPLTWQSGTLNTTPVAGGAEYDGLAFYFGSAASTRGAVAAEQAMALASSYTLAPQTAAQRLFDGSSGGAVTLPVGLYRFECQFAVTGLSSTSGSYGFALAGGATHTEAWEAIAAQPASLSAATQSQASFNTAANTALTTSSTNTTGHASIRGLLRVTASGTLIPQISLTVASAAVVQANSYFKVSPISGTPSMVAVGNWS